MQHRFLVRALALGLCTFASAFADAQEFPSKPIRLIVPFPPGGATEPLARMLAQKLPETFGQQVIVDNRGGAGTTIGVELATRAPADGYTLLLSSIANAISAGLYQKLNYDLVRDIGPITLLATTSGVLVAHPTLPVKTVRELIALAKARPGELAYGSSGSGTPNHLSAELFNLLAGVKLVHVPYKGGGPAVIALLSGETPLAFPSTPSAIQYIRSGRMRALGVSTAQRLPSLPEVPTIAEAGVKGYDAETWYGLSAPVRTPREIIARVHAGTLKAFAGADVRERLDAMGYQLRTSTPEEFGAFVKNEVEKWRKVIKAANMAVD
jgi:tripartite-type tricarboxylate transporter receptor subunit TctC